MFRLSILLILIGGSRFNASATGSTADVQKNQKEISSPKTLNDLIEKALAHGLPGRIPHPFSDVLDVPRDIPTSHLKLFREQTDDKMSHLFKVIVAKSSASNTKPIGLELMTTYNWPGNYESYVFRVSLDGKLERAGYGHGKVNKYGKGVKGSGMTMIKDINSPEIKERFQHEMDLWLKKTYLKKEWRSAEFSNGVLQR